MLVKMVQFGYLRVEKRWQSKLCLDRGKKGIDKINAILYKFGQSSKCCPKNFEIEQLALT